MATDWSDDIVISELTDEPALSDELASLIERVDEANPPPNVVLNFAAVSYVASSNLAQLLRLKKSVERGGRQLRLCSVTEQIRQVMQVTGLEKLFAFAPDPMTALAGLQLEDKGG